MIGKWNKSVILTYLGTAFSVFGMFLCYTVENGIMYAFLCLMLAGICDLFDGTVARRCKRTEEEKAFGIQLDSLADVVSFVVYPVVLAINLGLNRPYDFIIYAFYVIFGIARLAYFNIIAECTEGPVPYYKGLPVTAAAIVFPVVYLLKFVFDVQLFNVTYLAFMSVVAICFVLDIKIKKPHGIAYIIFPILGAALLAIYCLLIF